MNKRKRCKHFVSLGIVLTMFISLFSSAHIVNATETKTYEVELNGTGTEADPYVINDADDLLLMAQAIDNDVAYADDYYEMSADIDLTGVDFKPIGATHHFAGVFDGKGHTVSNLTINEPSSANVGFFAFVENGTIKNFGVESGTIHGNWLVGAIIGRSMYATLINCFSKADVIADSNCGGLVGMFNSSTMANCYSFGRVSATVAESVGGLAGSTNRSLDLSADCSIDNCYSIAEVNGNQFVGALVGYDESAAGEIYHVNYSHLYYEEGRRAIGNNTREETIGLSTEDLTNGTLINKLNEGCKDGYASWVEGMSGYPEFTTGMSEIGLIGKGTKEAPYKIKTADDLLLMAQAIDNDVAYADDYYEMSADIDLTGVDFKPIGATHHFAGVFDGKGHTVSNLTINEPSGTNVGFFAFVENGTIKNFGIESGTINGHYLVGAVVGRSMYATLINCFSKADVIADSNCGGLVGMFNSSTMVNCYSFGRVSATVAESVGGLAGSTNRSLDLSADCSIDNCYSIAEVNGNQFVGTLVGYDESAAGEIYHVNYSHLYYEEGRRAIGNNTREETIGLSTEDLTNGTLINKLNEGCKDEYASWFVGNLGYPEFEGKTYIETTLKGEGTIASPYLIQTTDDLLEMARVVNLSKDFASANYKLTASLDLRNVVFNGIGTSNQFSGVFDGAGHIITNINIKAGSKQNVGFFNSAYDATIKNFGIENGLIEGGYNVGAFVGNARYTTIINCYNNATVKGFEVVGGLVGMLSNSDIVNSYNSGTVRGPRSLGGLAGSIKMSSDISRQPNIKNSFNIGNVFWATYSGEIVGNSEDGSNIAKYENVYYNSDVVPNIAVGNFVEVHGIRGMSKADMNHAAFVEMLNDHDIDEYGKWILAENGSARLAMFGEAAEIDKFMASINDQPEIVDGKLVLPESETGRYQAVLYGSNNKQVIDLNGNVHTPLTDQRVYLIYNIIDTEYNNEIVAQLDRNVILDVKGLFDNSGINEVPNVVPGLREWYGFDGSFKLINNARIVAETEDALDAAEKLQMFLKKMVNISLEVVQETAKDGDIVIRYTPEKLDELGDEGYYIHIGNRVVIEAPTNMAMIYGSISIAQILYQDVEHANIPKGIVRDYPEYSVRGGNLDVARQYFPLDYVEEIGTYMAWFKLNRFIFHISDDGGESPSPFRIESKLYPQLNSCSEGYVWSQDDFRQMQKNLNEYGVKVVVEMDTPAHASTFNFIDPSIMNGGTFDLANHYDECLAMAKRVYDEFLDGNDPVFQSAIVNIGTDESSNTNENMRRYINDLSQYLLSKKNIEQVYFWGNLSVYYGETEVKTDHLISMIWDSPDFRVDEALESGFDVINATSNSMYIVPGGGNGIFQGYVDMATFYDNWRGTMDFDANERIGNPCMMSNRNYYAEFDLLLGNPQILGNIFSIWNDIAWANEFDAYGLMLSYIATISEKSWYGDENRFETGKEFVKAFDAVGHYTPISNPGRYVETDSTIIAQYDFEEMVNGQVTDIENGYNGTVINGNVITKDDEHQNVLQLNGNTRMSLPFKGVGYPYTVTFDLYLDGKQNDDAILFKSDDSTFYLNYKNRGVGYAMGRYGFSFDVEIPTDRWVTVSITSTYIHGSISTTSLKMDGISYSPTCIENPSSVTRSASSFLGTSEMFTGIRGFVDNLGIGNKFDQILGSDEILEFKGDGTEESPYLITSEKELMLFSSKLNSGEYVDSYFRLENDLNMAGFNYIPVREFRGTLDGNSHTISNFMINASSTTNVGLIGFLIGGTVKNLGIESGTIKGDSMVGALVGRTMYATIMNCYSKADIIANSNSGGLIGMNNNSRVSNCFTWGSVSGTSVSIGGLIGSSCNSLDPSVESIIENCYSIAEVKGDQFVGAISGWDENFDTYVITYTNVFYDSSKQVFGIGAAVEGTIAIDTKDFTNGVLLERLNAGLQDGYREWEEGMNGYPEYVKVQQPADYTKVDEAIANAEKIDRSLYKDVSALDKAIEAVVRDLDITKQAEVDAMAKAIEDALAKLEYKDADYSKVDEAIAKAEALNKDEYEDLSALEEALANVVRGKNITQQDEVDAMTQAIEAALAGLVKVEQPTEPQEPVDPIEPTKPEQPVVDPEPQTPTRPTTPTENEEPTVEPEPEEPTQPEKPAEPEKPEKPNQDIDEPDTPLTNVNGTSSMVIIGLIGLVAICLLVLLLMKRKRTEE